MPRVLHQKLNAGKYYIWENKMEVIISVRGLWSFDKDTQTGTVLANYQSTK